LANDYGIDPVHALFNPENDPVDLRDRVVLKTSRKTGKIRNILFSDGEKMVHLLSLRAEDGILTFRIEGARKLISAIPSPWKRVIVDPETGEFNAKGLNVFCKFILRTDPDIRPGDDVMVADETDRLLAVGRAQGSGQYLKDSRTGIGVKVREGILSGMDNDKN
jgi:predicted RNA-binding protein (TIGR00451 family)